MYKLCQLSFAITIICTINLVTFAQNVKLKEIDPHEAKICEPPGKCVQHYQCINNTFNNRGAGIFSPRFSSEDSNELTDGMDTYMVPENNKIILKSGVEATVCNYLDRCCNAVVDVPKLPSRTDNLVPVTKGCGYRNPDGIYFHIKTDNSQQAQFGEFPWVVAIIWQEPFSNKPELKCGGSLIHPSVVLTAAHCIDNGQSVLMPNELTLRAGEWDTQTVRENIPYQERGIKQIIKHELFDPRGLLYDIALIIVATPFELVESIQPICLPTPNLFFDDEQDCYAAGWGKDKFEKKGRRQTIMKKVRLPIVSFEMCQDQLRQTRLGEIFDLHESFMCAGGKAGEDTCKGDGGSPLVCPVANQKNRYYQTGIVAWGIGCGENNVPAVYANVPYLREWVDRQMISTGYGTDAYTAK